jgi:hypothetical protein
MALADAPFQLRELLTSISSRNVNLPAPLVEGVQLWKRITESTPAPLPHNALRDAIIAGADEATVAGTLLQEVAGNRLTTAWQQAANKAAADALTVVMAHRNDIHAQLAVLADDCIAKIKSVADLGSTTLDTLVREGRHAEAKLYADRQTVASELNALYGIRDSYLVPGGGRTLKIDVYDCSRWQNPLDISNHVRGNGLAEQFISGLSAGGILYYPTAEVAVEGAQRLWDEYAAQEIERRKDQFGVGSTVYLG